MQLLLDTHCHTIASDHAFSTVMEYAKEAATKGLSLIAITDHAPAMTGSATPFHFINFKALPKTLFGVMLYGGVELNIMDKYGTIDLDENICKNLPVVIASLHIPCFPPATKEENTMAVVNVMQKPFVKVIGHLGDPRYPIDLEQIVNMAKKTNTALEINNASLYPEGHPQSSFRKGGDSIIKEMALLCKQKNVCVIVGSDAHFCTEIGEFFYAKTLLESIDFPEELVLNTSIKRFQQFFSIS